LLSIASLSYFVNGLDCQNDPVAIVDLLATIILAALAFSVMLFVPIFGLDLPGLVIVLCAVFVCLDVAIAALIAANRGRP
jgi:hypothetical protein